MKIPYKSDLVAVFLIFILFFTATTSISQAIDIIIIVMIILARDIKIKIDNKR